MNRPKFFLLILLVSASVSALDLDPSKFGEGYVEVATEAEAIELRTKCMKAECDKMVGCVMCMTFQSVITFGGKILFAKCLPESNMNICIRRYRVR